MLFSQSQKQKKFAFSENCNFVATSNFPREVCESQRYDLSATLCVAISRYAFPRGQNYLRGVDNGENLTSQAQARDDK